MKRYILFFAALFIINLASAQSFYGYCTAQLGGHTYISEVVDVTTLPNDNIPKIAPYGKIKLADYYDMVVKQWFTNMLAGKGLDVKQGAIYTQLIAGIEDQGNACKTGHEATCLCQNKNAAIDQRNRDLKSNPGTSVLK